MTDPPSIPELVTPALLGEAAECARAGFAVYDDHGQYVAVNEHACRMLGYTREELLTHDVAAHAASGIDRTVLLRPGRREGARVIVRKDGSRLPVAYVVVPTRVAGVAFYISMWWELEPDDPRAAAAS